MNKDDNNDIRFMKVFVHALRVFLGFIEKHLRERISEVNNGRAKS